MGDLLTLMEDISCNSSLFLVFQTRVQNMRVETDSLFLFKITLNGLKGRFKCKKKGLFDVFGFYSFPALSIRKYRLRVSTSHALATQKSIFVSTATVIRRSCLSKWFIMMALPHTRARAGG
jgi:hypothetical protein